MDHRRNRDPRALDREAHALERRARHRYTDDDERQRLLSRAATLRGQAEAAEVAELRKQDRAEGEGRRRRDARRDREAERAGTVSRRNPPPPPRRSRR